MRQVGYQITDLVRDLRNLSQDLQARYPNENFSQKMLEHTYNLV